MSVKRETMYFVNKDIIKDFCNDAIRSGRIPKDSEIDSLLYDYTQENSEEVQHIIKSTKNTVIFQVLNNIPNDVYNDVEKTVRDIDFEFRLNSAIGLKDNEVDDGNEVIADIQHYLETEIEITKERIKSKSIFYDGEEVGKKNKQ